MAETRYASRFRRVVARLRARGFTVVEEPGCYSRTVPGKDLLGVESHVPHHTAGGNDSSDRRVVRDGRTGLRGPLSQLLTETDGTLRLLATGYANHAGPTRRRYEGNSWSIGNEIVSRGRSSKDFTAAQVRAAEAAAEELAREFGYDLQSWTVGHKEIAVPAGRKVDPAFSMPDFRGRLSRSPAIPAVPLPTPDVQEDDMAQVPQAEWDYVHRAVTTILDDTGKTKSATGRIEAIVTSAQRVVGATRDRLEVLMGAAARIDVNAARGSASADTAATTARDVLAQVDALPAATAAATRRELRLALSDPEVKA
jgi:hypothetical protein